MLTLLDKINKLKRLLTAHKGIHAYFPQRRKLGKKDRYDLFTILLDFFEIDYVDINTPTPIPLRSGFLLTGRIPQEITVDEFGNEIVKPIPSCFFVQIVFSYAPDDPCYEGVYQQVESCLYAIADTLSLTVVKDGSRYFFMIPGTPPPKLDINYFN